MQATHPLGNPATHVDDWVSCAHPPTVLALLFSIVVAADGRDLVDEAQRAYHKGDFAQAAKLLEAASALDPSSRILFNLARALDKAGAVEKAITAYEAYLSRPDAELPALKKARAALTELYRARPSMPPLPPPSPPPVESPAAPTPAPVATPRVEVRPPVVVSPPPPAPPRPWRTTALIGAGAAVVTSGVALGLGAWTNGTATQARASLDPLDKPMLVAAAHDRALATDVTLFVAAGLALVSVIVFLVDWLATP